MKNLRTTVKDCTISIGIAVGIVALLETSFRISKFIYTLTPPRPNYSEIYRDRFIAFDKIVPIRDLKARQREVGDHLMYKPWVQIGNRDHKGEFSSVSDGNRTVKGFEQSKDCSSTKEIWMFGGSTTYGVGVPYPENIPSYLQLILNTHNTCYGVVNYGVPYHYSKQETINFVHNILDHENPPLIAIFLDGLNDFGQPGSTLRGEPFFTPVVTSLVPRGESPARREEFNYPIQFNLEIVSWIQREILNNTTSSKSYSNRDLPTGYTESRAAKEISVKFIENTINLGKICDAYAIKCFRFLQPIAAVDYTPPSNDALTDWTKNEKKIASRFRDGYSFIRNNSSTDFRGIKFIDISSVFSDYNGYAYVDGGHYSPRANKLIADSIYSAISPVIVQR